VRPMCHVFNGRVNGFRFDLPHGHLFNEHILWRVMADPLTY
jgi:hypothetical protein